MIVLFDEIYMSSPYILNKIRVFCNENLNFIVIGSGDVKQLPSIEPFTSNQNGEEYVDNCIDIIFNYNIFLQICKRVGGKDTEELNEIYDDFWETYLDWKLWIETPFSYTQMTSKNNIAYTVYTNIRCQTVANEVRKRLNKKDKYELGDILICRVYKKDEEGKLNVNIRWEVVEVEGRNVTIQDIKSKGQEPLMKIL